MQAGRILSEIDMEISRLQQARGLLAGTGRGRRSVKGPVVAHKNGRRKLSAEGRRALSEKLKARWAERKKRAAAK